MKIISLKSKKVQKFRITIDLPKRIQGHSYIMNILWWQFQFQFKNVLFSLLCNFSVRTIQCFKKRFKTFFPQNIKKKSASKVAHRPRVLIPASFCKVRKCQNNFFKKTFPPKNKRTNSTLLLWNLRLTCFHSFFGGNRRPQKKHFEN